MTDDFYFNISAIKLSITSLFSVQILSYLGASDMIYSNVIDSFISENPRGPVISLTVSFVYVLSHGVS